MKWDKHKAAIKLEEWIKTHLDEQILPLKYIMHLQEYLRRLDDDRLLDGKRPNLRESENASGDLVIVQGPPILKSDSQDQLRFRNRSQLCFSLTLRPTTKSCFLKAATFDLHLPTTSGIRFMKVHIDGEASRDPFTKPRSHLHPGFQHVHVPFPVMDPRAVLDFLIYNIMPRFTQ